LSLFAAPSYLARRGEPQTVDDLAQHELVAYLPAVKGGSLQPEALRRAFAASRFAVNDFGFLRSMLRAGAGIGLLQGFHVADDVLEGRLLRVLPEWSHLLGPMYVVYPAARYVPPRVIAFRDFVLESFRQRGQG